MTDAKRFIARVRGDGTAEESYVFATVVLASDYGRDLAEMRRQRDEAREAALELREALNAAKLALKFARTAILAQEPRE